LEINTVLLHTQLSVLLGLCAMTVPIEKAAGSATLTVATDRKDLELDCSHIGISAMDT
jgi:hypothetical protein